MTLASQSRSTDVPRNLVIRRFGAGSVGFGAGTKMHLIALALPRSPRRVSSTSFGFSFGGQCCEGVPRRNFIELFNLPYRKSFLAWVKSPLLYQLS